VKKCDNLKDSRKEYKQGNSTLKVQLVNANFYDYTCWFPSKGGLRKGFCMTMKDETSKTVKIICKQQ
jgi:hypothetical protein